jgi:hypothetical protein
MSRNHSSNIYSLGSEAKEAMLIVYASFNQIQFGPSQGKTPYFQHNFEELIGRYCSVKRTEILTSLDPKEIKILNQKRRNIEKPQKALFLVSALVTKEQLANLKNDKCLRGGDHSSVHLLLVHFKTKRNFTDFEDFKDKYLKQKLMFVTNVPTWLSRGQLRFRLKKEYLEPKRVFLIPKTRAGCNEPALRKSETNSYNEMLVITSMPILKIYLQSKMKSIQYYRFTKHNPITALFPKPSSLRSPMLQASTLPSSPLSKQKNNWRQMSKPINQGNCFAFGTSLNTPLPSETIELLTKMIRAKQDCSQLSKQVMLNVFQRTYIQLYEHLLSTGQSLDFFPGLFQLFNDGKATFDNIVIKNGGALEILPFDLRPTESAYHEINPLLPSESARNHSSANNTNLRINYSKRRKNWAYNY